MGMRMVDLDPVFKVTEPKKAKLSTPNNSPQFQCRATKLAPKVCLMDLFHGFKDG